MCVAGPLTRLERTCRPDFLRLLLAILMCWLVNADAGGAGRGDGVATVGRQVKRGLSIAPASLALSTPPNRHNHMQLGRLAVANPDDEITDDLSTNVASAGYAKKAGAGDSVVVMGTVIDRLR